MTSETGGIRGPQQLTIKARLRDFDIDKGRWGKKPQNFSQTSYKHCPMSEINDARGRESLMVDVVEELEEEGGQ